MIYTPDLFVIFYTPAYLFLYIFKIYCPFQFKVKMHEFASSADNENNHNPMDSFKLIAARGDILDDIQNGNQNLANSIEKRINEQKRFFGIEISPANSGDLDYNQFPVQPLFTSIAWLFDTNVNYHPLSTAPAIRLGKSAQHCSPVLMHLTCYKLTDAKLREFLDLEFKNILALKGGNLFTEIITARK